MNSKLLLMGLMFLCGVCSYAQSSGNEPILQVRTVQIGDTIFLKKKILFRFQMEEPLTIVSDSVATYVGIVKSEYDSTANVQIFRRPNKEYAEALLVGTRKVMADSLAAGQLVLIGRQVDFYPMQPPRIKMGRVYNEQHLLVSATMQAPTGHVFRKGFLQDGKYVEEQYYENDTLRLLRRSFPSNMFNLMADSEADQRYDRSGRLATEEQVPGDLWAFDDGVRVSFNRLPAFGEKADDLLTYLSENLYYPAQCLEEKAEGRSEVLFMIDTTGQVTGATIKESSGNEQLDKEALRVVSGMQKWQPAISDGKKVSVKFSVPINFVLPMEDNGNKQVGDEKQDNPLSLAELHEGDTLWMMRMIERNGSDIPYTTDNQCDPYPKFKYNLTDRNTASHYAIYNKTENTYILTIYDIICKQIVKVERYKLSKDGLAVLQDCSDFYNRGQIVYRELYQKGKRISGEWLNNEGNAYKHSKYGGGQLKTILTVDPVTQKIWKQKDFEPSLYSHIDVKPVSIRYFMSDGNEVNESLLDYQPPTALQTNLIEEDISRWISSHFVVAPYYHYVALFKWSGNVLVDETGAVAAFGRGKLTEECRCKQAGESVDRVMQEELLKSDMLCKLSEYIRYQPARRGRMSDIGEVPLSFCYSPLYYASTGDTLYCLSCLETTNSEGERTKVNLRNICKEYAPYYAVAKRTGEHLDLDFYGAANNKLLKRGHYLCIAPDSILPDGIVEMWSGNRMIPVKKFDSGKEYANLYLGHLSVGESIPVKSDGTKLIEYHHSEIIGITPFFYEPAVEYNNYAATIRSKSGDTVEVEYVDLKTNKRDEIERYVALSDDHYELKEQLVFIGDSMSIRTVFITDSTEYHYIYNENQELQTRYYVHLTESEDYFVGSLLYKKSEKSIIYWEEDFDNTGNLRVKKMV